MGTRDNGQFFEGNLEAGGIEISIEPDDPLIVFDSNDVEKSGRRQLDYPRI